MTGSVPDATRTIRLWPDRPPTRIDGVPEEVSTRRPRGWRHRRAALLLED